jgi:hypothetical protein
MGFVRASLFLVILVFAFLFCASSATAQNSILGFTPTSAAREAEIEKKFKAIPSPDEAKM